MPISTNCCDWPAVNWNDCAVSTPALRTVSVPGAVISPPTFVTVKVTCSSVGVKH